VSLATAPPAPRIQRMVEQIRYPRVLAEAELETD